jgi:aerobic C4-dicarboxylate transport protein
LKGGYLHPPHLHALVEVLFRHDAIMHACAIDVSREDLKGVGFHTTTSSETVLPRMLVKLEQLGCEESVVGLVIPTGYSFNLDGTCLYLASAALFLAQATNTELDLSQQIGLLGVLLLASKGAAGVAGAAFVVLAATLASTGTIPVTSVALVLGVHRLMSQGLAIGNAVTTIVVAKWENALNETRMHHVLDGEPAPLAST